MRNPCGRHEDSGKAVSKRPSLPVEQPAEIYPGLHIGDLDDVSNVNRLRRLGIGFVLNLCPEFLEEDYATLLTFLANQGIVHCIWQA